MISLHHADCLELTNSLEDNSVDLFFLDPPYNTGRTKNAAPQYDRNKDFESKKWKTFYAEDGWDSIVDYYAWCSTWLEAAQRKLKPKGSIMVCGSYHNFPEVGVAMKALGYYIISNIAWCIPNSFPNLAMTKPISANRSILWARKSKKVSHYYDKDAAKRHNNGKNLRDYWLINNDTQAGKLWKHPSKKPVELVHRAIDISVPKSNDTLIVDFFAGSGTTGLAVNILNAQYKLNMACVLGDYTAEYVELMERRLHLSRLLAA